MHAIFSWHSKVAVFFFGRGICVQTRGRSICLRSLSISVTTKHLLYALYFTIATGPTKTSKQIHGFLWIETDSKETKNSYIFCTDWRRSRKIRVVFSNISERCTWDASRAVVLSGSCRWNGRNRAESVSAPGWPWVVENLRRWRWDAWWIHHHGVYLQIL